LKFLGYYSPQNIEELCKQGKVSVSITVYDRKGEETIYFENGNHVLRIEDKIISQSGREIRSWNDLFQLDDFKDANYLNPPTQQPK
jgi:hypothetical protein